MIQVRTPTTLTIAALAALTMASCQAEPVRAPAVAASGETCAVPDRLPQPRATRAPRDEIVHDEPVAYHVLAVAWSPEQCRTGRDYPDARLQCAGNDFGFILHGLWPNGAGRRHPRYCRAEAPAMAPETVRQHFCMTPSPRLQQHEWAAHGTCGWDSAEAYFDQAAALWEGLNRPAIETIAPERLTAGAIRDAFVAANPGMPRQAVMIAATDDGWFREARICHDLDFKVMACPRRTGAPDRRVLKLAARGQGTGR